VRKLFHSRFGNGRTFLWRTCAVSSQRAFADTTRTKPENLTMLCDQSLKTCLKFFFREKIPFLSIKNFFLPVSSKKNICFFNFFFLFFQFLNLSLSLVGATVISTRCSEDYKWGHSSLLLFGIPIPFTSWTTSPRLAIQV
jgi:hypothetical protein